MNIEGITFEETAEEKLGSTKTIEFGKVGDKGIRETGLLGLFHKGKYLPTRWIYQMDDVTQYAWQENTKNFWLDRDINFTTDVQTWAKYMSDAEKVTFIKALTGLTGLDTRQGTNGMNLIAYHEGDGQVQAVLSWMGAMEHIHAKFYSKTFQSIISNEDIQHYMEDWFMNQKEMQNKLDFIVQHYNKLVQPDPTKEDLWKAKACSVMLESGLFYSGFYYPLALAGGIGSADGKARMSDTADGINLIIRDEAMHGQYIGWLAEKNFNEWFDEKEKEELTKWFYESIEYLYGLEAIYTAELYDEVGLTEDATNFVRFNFNRVCEQLGFETYFPHEEINPVIENGLRLETATTDFFSRKVEYFKANVQPIKDSDIHSVNRELNY